jgi:hypothetical protein
MICILFTDGVMNQHDIVSECKTQKWVPICVYREKSVVDAVPTVIGFNDQEMAKKFAKRNLPKDWVRGGVKLADEDVKWIKDKGWNIEIFTFPKLMNSHPVYEISFEVLEFSEEPDLRYQRG